VEQWRSSAGVPVWRHRAANAPDRMRTPLRCARNASPSRQDRCATRTPPRSALHQCTRPEGRAGRPTRGSPPLAQRSGMWNGREWYASQLAYAGTGLGASDRVRAADVGRPASACSPRQIVYGGRLECAEVLLLRLSRTPLSAFPAPRQRARVRSQPWRSSHHESAYRRCGGAS